MGFSNDNYDGGSGKYANFKEGKIVTKIDGEKKTFTTITGTIVDLDIQDAEFAGNKYRKIVLYLLHENGVTQLGFNLGSGYGWGFFQMCGNIDPKKEVSISGGTKPNPNNPNKNYGSIFIKQDGKNLKHLMKKDSEAGKKIPPVEEVTVGKNVVKNYEKRDEYMERVITAFYKKVQKAFPDGAGAYKGSKHEDADVMEVVDDLPF